MDNNMLKIGDFNIKTDIKVEKNNEKKIRKIAQNLKAGQCIIGDVNGKEFKLCKTSLAESFIM